MTAPPPVAMPTAVMTTAPVSRLPKFSATSKAALTPKNSSANTTANATANTTANATANANGDMGQAASLNNAQSISAVNSRLSVGFYHHSLSSSGVKSSPISGNGKHGSFIRTPTNFKWRKENVEDAAADFEYRQGRKTTSGAFTGKTRAALNQNGVSGPKATPAKAAAPRSTLNCLAKKQNGGSLAKTRSVSPQEVKKATASRSHSTDNIGKLTERDKARSRSLTQPQSQKQESIPKSRAFSTNRAERKSGSAASALPMATVRKVGLRSNGAALFKDPGPIRAQKERRNHRRNSVETPSENSPGSSPEAPDSRGPSSERGSQTEVSLLGETLEDMSLSSSSSLDHHHISQDYMDDFDNLGNGSVGEMLLTSCGHNDDDDSGLDRSRFHDDDRLVGNGISTATDLCFLDDGLDWNHIRLTSDRDHALRRLSRRRRSSQQDQPDYHSQCGSSLDLSPSDSCGSGGTFLWDEEVEPLGGAVQIQVQSSVQTPVRTHSGLHQNLQTKLNRDRTDSVNLGSLNSDVSSIDVLNDLESCDLDEDDLMLDVDFPEDHSLSDGGSYMAEWRRRQLCWGAHTDTDSEFHTDKVSEEQQSKRKDSELSLDLCLNSVKSCGLGVDLEELMDDCSAVKTHLEHLQKMLLLQEEDADEDTLTTDTLSPETDSSSDGTETQVEVLLQEVLQLREEVRSRDRTIAQLSQQLTAVSAVSSRCRCESVHKAEAQTQTKEKETESAECQTPWSHSTPAILQPNQSLQDPLTDQSGSPSDAPPPRRPNPAPLPSKLSRLLVFPGSSQFRATPPSSSPAPKRKPAHSPGSRVKPGPAPSASRLPKPKTP